MTVKTERIAFFAMPLQVKADKAQERVDASMSDLEKALVIHDYLIQDLSYDDNRLSGVHASTIYGFLTKYTICGGYAAAFKRLFQVEKSVDAVCDAGGNAILIIGVCHIGVFCWIRHITHFHNSDGRLAPVDSGHGIGFPDRLPGASRSGAECV